ncbi:cold-shock protein [Acetobacteroides hydrogenigenes]|uniref:Cold shock CspA family protein n=1 Tax=Acetobacteroides hydrogenigenes TaxID=979970 RepID=A0A4R2E8J4_9BACT|nr:cold shock domain-containing protein [Acetobacteroides hydrogenigenes]TCN64513.1 cold shock CspA family protein [Acetobacteroides hydrogenigenes]
MARPAGSWNKKEVQKKKDQKRKEKEQKKLERKESGRSSLDDMIAYVDENGMITSTPPDPTTKAEIDLDDIQISVPKDSEVEPVSTTRTGIVTFFNESKGFGFIKDLKTQESIFVHVNGLIDEVKENNRVTFEVEKGLKGPMAVKVKLDK